MCQHLNPQRQKYNLCHILRCPEELSFPMQSFIVIRGASEHNLKSVDLDIPRDSLVVITGLSGSGKSSLAFDTLYAEGQRRYVESLSAYARQFLELMQKPRVESIEGLSPAISIEQKTTSRNPRSTVGTVTEIYDYCRLLYARIGIPYSPATGLPISSQTVSQMVDTVMANTEGTRIYVLAPIVRGRKGEYRKELGDLLKQGFQRVRIDGNLLMLDDLPELKKNIKHSIEVVVDRLVLHPDIGSRVADSIELALNLADGLAIVEDIDSGDCTTFSAKFACPVSGFTIEEIEPRLFSFNNPYGACPTCDGLGSQMYVDADLVVPDDTLSLRAGAIVPWAKSGSRYYTQTLISITRHFDDDIDVPFSQLKIATRDAILNGTDTTIEIDYNDGERTYTTKRPFEGVIPNLERRLRQTDSIRSREELSRYQSGKPCGTCQGQRLKPESLSVKINHLNIAEVVEMTIVEARHWFKTIKSSLTQKQQEIANRILREINERLGFLDDVGLHYLTLSRNAGTLSGGESQRIRLASQIGAGLTGVLYVLDEPSIGLHQRDNARLLETLKKLRDLGNTVVMVEHDEEAIHEADHVVDMGPGAGIHGGQVIAEGKVSKIIQTKESLTGQYLCGTKSIPIPNTRRKPDPRHSLIIKGARANNLKNIEIDFPLGTFTCVTGVSGSGKSTLIIETLYKALARQLHSSRFSPGAHKSITGIEHLDKVIDIDQSPIGRSPRSNPATYTGAFTPIRQWYAGLPESGVRGYQPGRFSFNVKGGRCEACSGAGSLKLEMNFLPDVWITCDTCKGKRYTRETLEVLWKGKNIHEVLEMSVSEAADFFSNHKRLNRILWTLESVGLGYIRLGQPATTLSGGEAQRVKLASELGRPSHKHTFYILDEPTTGLSFYDVEQLISVLAQLRDKGHTVLVIEHHLDVIKSADWVIDLGPEGGDRGGQIVAEGTPEDVSKIPTSYTGQYLNSLLTGVKINPV